MALDAATGARYWSAYQVTERGTLPSTPPFSSQTTDFGVVYCCLGMRMAWNSFVSELIETSRRR
jgi:hypothetical protein